ncbi:cupin domain-containing protein [Mycobacteroides abscessus subsp. bolletii]|nr:cupin domain-containing protein [Mycobacteroides abscessus subsp. bolletii]SKQ44200.1 cupin domain-containing protein [Mycobacteroides abscessus subsp. massiliense]SHW76889.1 cupin domain-containing protein [Mycobacteroides abscessus subsp. bolletii]SHX36943.1 cupin domain-containing protein [Mycobacteroides abscessus subsp. bolletii]SHX58211.1 cupin domain-containing protein [Mycobacteroides abscessus subsp. bolletii]
MALAARHKLAEHENPGEATLLVLGGLVELATSTARATLAAGECVVIPQERHELTAMEDSVVLLTVVSRAGEPPGCLPHYAFGPPRSASRRTASMNTSISSKVL